MAAMASRLSGLTSELTSPGDCRCHSARTTRRITFMFRVFGNAGRRLLTFMMFKSEIDDEERQRLVSAGFTVPTLNKNPYLG